jgi:activator of HSP90 ATPase
MAKTIIHEVVFKNTTPETLYDLYMNADQHSHITGGPVTITDKEGGNLSAHQGYITGKNLRLVRGKLIVQTWRAMNWNADDVDSIFILTFEPKGKDVAMSMVHANIPDEHVAGVDKGWHEHYWNPWKQHLAGEQITRPQM